MKLSYIKLPNEILEMNLTANELAVLFYLSSIYAKGRDTLQVKQSTIAKKCRIKTTQTVSKITAKLADMGLIIRRRCIFDNNSTGMIYYTLNLPKAARGYFFVQRQVLNEQLTPAQLRVYLFICRSLSPTLGKCWNSYNDLARFIGITRSKAIEIIAQLLKKNVIARQRMKTRKNKRVFGDNHYMVVCYVPHSPIRGSSCKSLRKNKGLPFFKNSPAGQTANLSAFNIHHASNDTTERAFCQADGKGFFGYFLESGRGGTAGSFNRGVVPKIKALYINQDFTY